MKTRQYYNRKAAAKFVGISTNELEFATSNSEIHYTFQHVNGVEDENGAFEIKYHWSDLVQYRNSLKRKERGGCSADLRIKRAAKYLDISEGDLMSFVRLGWIEPNSIIGLIFSEFTLDEFMKNILAPISRIVDVRAL